MPIVSATQHLGGFVGKSVLLVGDFVLFVARSTTRIFHPLVNRKLLFAQLEFVGSRSLLIILMAGVMVGGIFGFQLGEIFTIFGAESLIGASTGFALARELAPMIGAFLVTARAGSAMAAEIAS
ncbi:MAG: ABC transporter permease, partial [Proteobacteria bacterium]|nr:ABC transporter permease [Pseudomonadota bacterium]